MLLAGAVPLEREERETRQPWAVGFAWAYRLMSVAFQFTVPALLGYLADRWIGSLPWFTLLGAILGFVIGMLELIAIAREKSGSP
jgi:F0F1-type ATP synthase assembly protein I